MKRFHRMMFLLVMVAALLLATNLSYASSTYVYRYDANNRLMEIVRDGKVVRSFGYDANGNLTRVKRVENLALKFQRSSKSYNSEQKQLIHHEPRLEAGFFSDRSSQNLLSKDIATGESKYWGTTPFNGTIDVSAEQPWEGKSSLKIFATGSERYLALEAPLLGGEAGKLYTFSSYVRSTAGAKIRLDVASGSPDLKLCTQETASGNWERIVCTTAAALNEDGKVNLQYAFVATDETGEAVPFFLDGLQLEQKEQVTSWVLPSNLGKAIGVEKSTQNFLAHPRWVDGEHDWSEYATGTATGIGSVAPNTQRLEIEKTDTDGDRFGYMQNKTWLANGGVLTDSFWIRKHHAAPGAKFKLRNNYVQQDGSTLSDVGLEIDLATMEIGLVNGGTATIQDKGGGWYKVSFTTNSHSNVSGMSAMFIDGAKAKLSLEWIQKEPHDSATSFTLDYRSNEKLEIQLPQPIRMEEGTWEHMFYVTDDLLQKSEGTMLRIDQRIGGLHLGFNVMHHPIYRYWRVSSYDPLGQFSTVTFPDTLTAEGWHRFVMTWKSSELKVYIDGTEVAKIAQPKLPGQVHGMITVGSSDLGNQLNTLYEDMRMSSVARTATEIAASYAANAPLPFDGFTIFKSDFDDLQ